MFRGGYQPLKLCKCMRTLKNILNELNYDNTAITSINLEFLSV